MAVCECNGELVLKKSPSWCLRGRQQQGYKQTRVSDAAGNRHSRRLAAYDGANTTVRSRCSTTSASKIRFLQTTCYVSSTATSVSILCGRSCVHPTAKRGDRRLIRKCCRGSCCWGYLYGITSERKLLEELRMHLAWRWFTGLGFEQEIPHHSTFSKNRHGRFQESNLFQELF